MCFICFIVFYLNILFYFVSIILDHIYVSFYIVYQIILYYCLSFSFELICCLKVSGVLII